MTTFFIFLCKKITFMPMFLILLGIFYKSIGIDAKKMVKKIKIVATIIDILY